MSRTKKLSPKPPKDKAPTKKDAAPSRRHVPVGKMDIMDGIDCGGGFTYLLYYWDGDDQVFRTDTDSRHASVLLFALQEDVPISPWADEMLHFDRKATPLATRRTLVSVKAFVRRSSTTADVLCLFGMWAGARVSGWTIPQRCRWMRFKPTSIASWQMQLRVAFSEISSGNPRRHRLAR